MTSRRRRADRADRAGGARLIGIAVVLAMAALPCAIACGNGSSGFPAGDDASSNELEDGSASQGGSSSSGGSSGSSSGTHPGSSSSGGHASSSSSGASGSGGACVPAASAPRVTSNISFTDAGALCGNVACDLTDHVCCVDYMANGSCLAAGSSCPPSTVVGRQVPQAQFDCLQASDCVCGEVCCAIADDSTNSASAGSTCQDISKTGACQPIADAGAQSKAGSAQLCQTQAECKNGMSCLWQVCSVSTPYGPATPNLTMCGMQADAPFNCKACPGSTSCGAQGS